MKRDNHLVLVVAIEHELALAESLKDNGDFHSAFYHLELAHVLGQASTYQHTRIHWRMFKLAIKQRSPGEIWGQIVRIVGASTKTPFGIYPVGNTGGANVLVFQDDAYPRRLAGDHYEKVVCLYKISESRCRARCSFAFGQSLQRLKAMNKQEHWENVYQSKGRDEVSWFREHLDTSLQMIANTNVGKDAAIIDVGGGNSNLVDDLIERGYVDAAVLDISAKAITDSKERLGRKAEQVNWIVADITEAELPTDHFDVWHDRAVFHFLTDEKDRRKYVELVMRSLKPTGHIIVASFSLDGPKKCSGLDVMRYSPEKMHDEFGNSFQLIESVGETHNTPFGTTQDFVYCYCRKV